MMVKRGDKGFLDAIRTKLYVAVVSDVLDSLGHMHQAMSAAIRPLDDSLVLAGYARTGLYQDIYHIAKGENPYELEIALIDDLAADDVPYSPAARRDESLPGESFYRRRRAHAARLAVSPTVLPATFGRSARCDSRCFMAVSAPST